MAHSGVQQLRIPQQNQQHHCKDCGLYFDSVKSLDVHLHYHKENLLSKWASQGHNVPGEESNNNSHKTGNNNNGKHRNDFGNNSAVSAPADSSDSMIKKEGPPTPGAPGRPSSTSSIAFSQTSPPVSAPYSYNSSPSPYQNDNHRFSPGGGLHNYGYLKNGRQSPPQQNGQFANYPASYQNYLGEQQQHRSPPGDNGYFAETHGGSQQQDFVLGGGMDFPTNNAGTLRTTTTSSVPSPAQPTVTPSYRYHPYHNPQTNSYPPPPDRSASAVSSSTFAQSSPPHAAHQCDKCGFICDSPEVLMDHIAASHPPAPSPLILNHQGFLHAHRNGYSQRLAQELRPGMHPAYHNNQADVRAQLLSQQAKAELNQQIKAESPQHQIKIEDIKSEIKSEIEDPPAEILDLDSHKVHVYQLPPEEEEAALRSAGGRYPHSVSAMLWGSGGQQKQFQQMAASPPPGYGGVSTSSQTRVADMTPAYPQQRGYNPNPANLGPVPPHHQPLITSTQVPHMTSLPPNHAPPPPPQPPQQQQPPPQQKGSGGNQTWKSNEARRPKTYNCSACNKWFTSSGHLKRHYNTTLHKNAVKQSGVPDPASMPMSQHHYPNRDPNTTQRPPPNSGGGRDSSSPPPSLLGEDSSRSDDASQGPMGRITPQHPHNMMPPSNNPASPPNRLAGPSEMTSGGLQTLSSYNNEDPSSVRTSPGMPQPHHYLMGAGSPSMQPLPTLSGPHLLHHSLPQQSLTPPAPTAYPNSLPPHVSTTQSQLTTHQHNHITTSGSVGLDDVQQSHPFLGGGGLFGGVPTSSPHQPLPSFAQLHQSHLYGNPGNSLAMFTPQYPGYHMVSTLDHVGGLCYMEQRPYSTSPINNNNSYHSLGSLEDDVQHITCLDSETRYSPTHHNNNHMHSDSSPSLADDISNLSPLGTPDCPTSTNEDLEQNPLTTPHKADDGINIISSTNVKLGSDAIARYSSSDEVKKTSIHKCVDCDKVFNKACYLTQHNKSFHSGHKPFKCNRCGKRFPSEYLYQEHLGKHAGEKPYKCEICPKQFNHKTDLRRHMCLHTGEKPYACDVCGKGFIRKDHMLKHCDTHRRKAAQLLH